MLHALLRNKLAPTIPEPERLEDALTSAVFGAILWTESWSILNRWFGLDHTAAVNTTRAHWFWPRLELAEPDVVIRNEECLIVVEAKLRSGRHDLAASPDDEERISDQLVRQFHSMTMARNVRLNYEAELERAIRECRILQVLVVDACRIRRARREYEESRAGLPESADLRLVTWQQLYSILSTDSNRPQWASDVMAYLDVVGLDSFNGIGRTFVLDGRTTALAQWRAVRHSESRMKSMFADHPIDLVNSLHSWRAGAVMSGLHAIIILAHAASDVLNWRSRR